MENLWYEPDERSYHFDKNGNVVLDSSVAAFSKGAGFEQPSSSGQSSSTAADSSLLTAANKATRKKYGRLVDTLEEQKSELNEDYDDVAKRAYADYRKKLHKLPSLTANLATGTADSLEKEEKFDYEDSLNKSEKQRKRNLSNLEQKISDAEEDEEDEIENNKTRYGSDSQ